MGPDQGGGLHTFLIRGIQPAVADIVHDRAGEQIGVLQHDAHAAAQICFLDFVDIDPIIPDLAVGDIVKPVDEVGDGGFTRPGGADKRDLLARLGIERDAMQDGFLRCIAEIHVIQPYIPCQAGVGDRAVAVGMLPGP